MSDDPLDWWNSRMKLVAAARDIAGDDHVLYWTTLARQIHKGSPDLLAGPVTVVPEVLTDEPDARITDTGERPGLSETHTLETAFPDDAKHVAFLRALRDQYGDCVILVPNITYINTEGKSTKWVSYKVHVMHSDFLTKWQRGDIKVRPPKYSMGDYEKARDMFKAADRRSLGYRVHESVSQTVRDLYYSIYVDPYVDVDGVRHVPVMKGQEAGSFEDCPTFGEAVELGDPDLLQEGVVIDLLGVRYKVRMDWKSMEDPCHPGTTMENPNGRHLITVQRTDEPLTEYRERSGWHYRLQMRGVGRSQQMDIAPRLDGELPYCLAVFDAGTDFTWCVMAHVDAEGMIKAAWFDGSCT